MLRGTPEDTNSVSPPLLSNRESGAPSSERKEGTSRVRRLVDEARQKLASMVPRTPRLASDSGSNKSGSAKDCKTASRESGRTSARDSGRTTPLAESGTGSQTGTQDDPEAAGWVPARVRRAVAETRQAAQERVAKARLAASKAREAASGRIEKAREAASKAKQAANVQAEAATQSLREMRDKAATFVPEEIRDYLGVQEETAYYKKLADGDTSDEEGVDGEALEKPLPPDSEERDESSSPSILKPAPPHKQESLPRMVPPPSPLRLGPEMPKLPDPSIVPLATEPRPMMLGEFDDSDEENDHLLVDIAPQDSWKGPCNAFPWRPCSPPPDTLGCGQRMKWLYVHKSPKTPHPDMVEPFPQGGCKCCSCCPLFWLPKRYRKAVPADLHVNRFLVYAFAWSSFFYTVAGSVVLLFLDLLRTHNPVVPWFVYGCWLILQGFLSFANDVVYCDGSSKLATKLDIISALMLMSLTVFAFAYPTMPWETRVFFAGVILCTCSSFWLAKRSWRKGQLRCQLTWHMLWHTIPTVGCVVIVLYLFICDVPPSTASSSPANIAAGT